MNNVYMIACKFKFTFGETAHVLLFQYARWSIESIRPVHT